VLLNKPLDLAIQHVSTTLLKRIATVGNLVDCMDGTTTVGGLDGDPFRRRLRFLRGRGSNSLLGIEATGGGRLEPTEQVCQFQTSGGGEEEEEEEEVEQFLDGVTGDFSGSVILEVEVGQSQGGEREEQEEDRDVVLAETRVDGVIDPASVIRSALPENKQKVVSEEEVEEVGGGAFNYLSTQSEIKEAKSIRTQPTVGEKNIIGSVSYRQGPITTKLRTTGLGSKCNVIQGEITLFISNTADPFENLDGRILEAIKDDLNDELIVQQEFLNDEVVGIRLLEPALVNDAVLPSLPTISVPAPVVPEPPVPAPLVASAAASAPSNINPSSGFASSNASIGVIGGLGAIFLMLVGLFAYTSRPRKKKRRYRLGSHHNDDDDLKSFQYDDDDDEYESELDAVAGVMGETESTATWWQEPVRVTRTATGSSIPTIEACYSNQGVVIGDDEEIVANDKSPKVLPLSFFSDKKSKLARDAEEAGATSNIVRDLMKSESLLDDDRSSSTVDMDAHLHQDVEKSKKSKSLLGRRLFGRKRTNNDDVLIDDDVIIEETSSRSDSQDKGIETTAPFCAMAAYPSPSSVSSRTPPRSVARSRASKDKSANDGIVQTCSSGALSCIPGLPSPEIGDDQTDVSALTDNYTAYFARRGPPQCAQSDGEQLMRLATDVVRQCIAPTTDNISVSGPTSVGTSTRQQQLARRQQNGDADPFADCWNPFEGNIWQGWFE